MSAEFWSYAALVVMVVWRVWALVHSVRRYRRMMTADHPASAAGASRRAEGGEALGPVKRDVNPRIDL